MEIMWRHLSHHVYPGNRIFGTCIRCFRKQNRNMDSAGAYACLEPFTYTLLFALNRGMPEYGVTLCKHAWHIKLSALRLNGGTARKYVRADAGK